MNKIILLWLFVALFLRTNAQTDSLLRFDLSEAQAYAMLHNYQIINAITDIELANKKVKETRGQGLPQIDASLSYRYNIDIPTSILPAEIFGGPKGEYAEVQFGTKNNITADVTLKQLLFSGSYITALQASKAYQNLSKTQKLKVESDIKEAVANAYYASIILNSNKLALDSLSVAIGRSLLETRKMFEAGFAEDTDVDQLDLMKSELEAALIYNENETQLAVSQLKFLLGIPLSQDIELKESFQDLLNQLEDNMLINSDFRIEKNIQFIQLRNQQRLAALNLQLEKSAYLPTLSAFFTRQGSNQFTEAKNAKWFPTTVVGVQLNVPIFSSGIRHYKVQQAKLEIEKLSVNEKLVRQKLEIDLSKARSDFRNSFLIFKNRHKSLKHAKKIYNKTGIKYKNGMASSMNLLQAHNQFLSSEKDYLLSALEMLMKKAHLEKILTQF